MMILRGVIYFVVFCFAIIMFFPKNEAIAFVEQNFLISQEVEVNTELENTLKGYLSKQNTLFYQNNKIASNESLLIQPLLVYNQIKIKNTTLEGMVGSFFPKKIETINITHSIFKPKLLHFIASGEFGNAKGSFDLQNMMLSLELQPSSLMNKNYGFILKNMKKNGKVYTYEYKI